MAMSVVRLCEMVAYRGSITIEKFQSTTLKVVTVDYGWLLTRGSKVFSKEKNCFFEKAVAYKWLACEQAPGLGGLIYRSARSASNEVRSAEEGEPACIFLNAGCHPQKPRGELSLSAVKFQPISAHRKSKSRPK